MLDSSVITDPPSLTPEEKILWKKGEPENDDLIIQAHEELQAQLSSNQQINAIVRGATEPTGDMLQRLVEIKAARNPLYEAAIPLLLMLAQVPQIKLKGMIELEAFRELLKQEVVSFQTLCNRANIAREHATTGSYCLCTALDEAVNSTSWGGGGDNDIGPWARDMLAKTYHGDTDGGQKFFMLVGRLTTQPELHRDLLELMYYILSLGFQGKYSNVEHGGKNLEMIRQRLYTMFMANREPVEPELSAHWHGETSGKFSMLRSVPVWVTVSVLSLVLLGMFGWYQFQLTTQSDYLVEEINAIGKMTSPPVQAAPLKLAQRLKDEIARGLVTVDENDSRCKVTFKGDHMFVAGEATVNQRMLPLLNQVAAEIAKVTGQVQVIGYTDTTPVRTPQFPNNLVLSKQRAARVGDVLHAGGVATNRLEIIGRGDAKPLAKNTTAAGRAKNRRVEITVTQRASPAELQAGSELSQPSQPFQPSAVAPAHLRHTAASPRHVMD